MSDEITQIKITFPCEVVAPEGFEQALDALLGMVTAKWQQENTEHVMWVAGVGGEPKGNIYANDNVDYDMSVLCFDVDTREDTSGRNPHNPNRETLRAKYHAERLARKKKLNTVNN